ncbi:MAG: DUF2914 domain-containing protein [Deltaproteobacteria bacterium]|nr:MAG: DUF2914 domain-containing protein [Deltaproteobacteria bacterium]
MRLLKVILSAYLISLALFNPALTEEVNDKKKSQEETKIGVVMAVICREVKDLSPVCESDIFPADIGKLYCFTRVTGGKKGDIVKHIWHYQGRPLLELNLSIKSSDFRTYSSKKIRHYQKGKWRVDVMSLDGINLATLNFTIK